MSLHIVHFLKLIDQNTLSGLENAVLGAIQQGATEISIHLSSEGGNNDQGFAAYYLLKSLPVPLTIKCIGNVESMAVILFLAADNRIIAPHGKVKIHPMHWGFTAGSVDHDRLSEFVDSLDYDANRYAEIFDERTSNSQSPINVREHLAGKAKLLNANEAVESGIATKIEEICIPAGAVTWWIN